MTERINTTDASKESVSWTPAGPFTVQVQFAKAESRGNVQVMARIDAAAPWASLMSFNAMSEPFAHCPYKPVGEVKLVLAGNTSAELVKAWSIE